MSLDTDFDEANAQDGADVAPPSSQLAVLLAHVRLLERRTIRLEESMEKNTAITTEVRDMLDTGKALFRLAGWVGNAVRWAGYLAGACLAVWGFWILVKHGGRPPP